MPRSYGYNTGSDDDYNEVTIVKTHTADRHGSNRHYNGDRDRGRRYSPDRVSVTNANYLGIPNNRPRASSQGAMAQPTIKIYNEMDRSPSRERRRPSHSRRDSGSSDDDYYRRKRRERERELERLERLERERERDREHERERDYEFRKQMDKLKLDSSKESDSDRKKRLLAEIAAEEKAREDERKLILIQERAKAAKQKEDEEELLKKAEAERALKKQKDKEARDKAVAEWKLEQDEKKQKEKAEEKKIQEEFEKRFRAKLRAEGIDEDMIEEMLERENDKSGHRRHSRGRDLELAIVNRGRPTYIKVAAIHLDTRTLDHHGYRWHWENDRREHIIVEEWIDQSRMDELFDHTRIHYRTTQRLIAGPVIRETTTTLRPNDVFGRNGNGLYVERRRSTSARPRSRSRGASVLRYLAT